MRTHFNRKIKIKTRIVLIPPDAEPTAYLNDETLILRAKSAEKPSVFFQSSLQYYGKQGFSGFYLGNVNFPFPPAHSKNPCIINDALLASRLANAIDEFNLWQRKAVCENNHHKQVFCKNNKKFTGENFKHYSWQNGADFIQVDVLFFGFHHGGLRLDLDTVVHIAGSESIMNKFATLLHAESSIPYEKDSNFIKAQTGDQYVKVPSFEFFVPDGCRYLQQVLFLFEKASTIALDKDIFRQCGVEEPELHFDASKLSSSNQMVSMNS